MSWLLKRRVGALIVCAAVIILLDSMLLMAGSTPQPEASEDVAAAEPLDAAEDVSPGSAKPELSEQAAGDGQQDLASPDDGGPLEVKAGGTLPLKVTIQPGCARQGEPMQANVQTTPGAAIALAVSYSNGQTYGQWGTFRAGPNGKFVYPWPVPVTAPSGKGKLLLGASDEARKESAAGYWEFRVADAGGC